MRFFGYGKAACRTISVTPAMATLRIDAVNAMPIKIIPNIMDIRVSSLRRSVRDMQTAHYSGGEPIRRFAVPNGVPNVNNPVNRNG